MLHTAHAPTRSTCCALKTTSQSVPRPPRMYSSCPIGLKQTALVVLQLGSHTAASTLHAKSCNFPNIPGPSSQPIFSLRLINTTSTPSTHSTPSPLPSALLTQPSLTYHPLHPTSLIPHSPRPPLACHSVTARPTAGKRDLRPRLVKDSSLSGESWQSVTRRSAAPVETNDRAAWCKLCMCAG